MFMRSTVTLGDVTNAQTVGVGRDDKPDFSTITCVTWTASGRNFGVGTPDGFVIYSTELVLPKVAHRESCATSLADANSGTADGDLREVYRCVIDGGVGTLALYEQCSIVAVSGIKDRASAARVQLFDLHRSRRPYSAAATLADTAAVMSDDDAGVVSSSSELNASMSYATTPSWSEAWESQWEVQVLPDVTGPLQPLSIAAANFAATVASVRLCPCFILVALTGDPNIVGSHQVYVFDRCLRQRHVFAVFPPSSNTFLQDLVATATTFTPTSGAGVSVRRFRALLPGEHRGEVRLLTLKCVSRAATAGVEPHPPHAPTGPATEEDEGVFVVGEKVLHQSKLRVVAMTQDGRRGATMGERGTRIKLLEFVEDNKIIERMTMERGRSAGVVESVSLQVVSAPPRYGGGDEAAGPVLVVCVTSTGTVHVFLCNEVAPQLLYTRDKHMCVPCSEYYFAHAAVVPQPTLRRERCVLCVLQWNGASGGLRHLTATRATATRAAAKFECRDGDHQTSTAMCRLMLYEVRMPRSRDARVVSSSGVGASGLSYFSMSLPRHGTTSLPGQSLTCAPVMQIPVYVSSGIFPA